MYLVFTESALLLTRSLNGSYCLPTQAQIAGLPLVPSVISVPQVNLLAYLIEPYVIASSAELVLVSLRQALNLFADADLLPTLIYAEQILKYQLNHRYCGRCGEQTQMLAGSNWLNCLQCAVEIYSRISPAMIVAVRRGQQLLMAQSHFTMADSWGLLAGFCEIGESLEQTVVREVKEEIGITVANIRYFGSQYWPFPHSLMVAYTADYVSGELVLDHNELRAAGFFSKEQLPGRPSIKLSIAHQLIDEFIRQN